MMSAKTTTIKKSLTKHRGPKKPKVIEHPKSSKHLFTNREIGWLEFNRRVLNEAADHRTPLLERVRFLAICGSNFDEFFMKRVGGLKRQVQAGISAKSADGKSSSEQLVEIRKVVAKMLHEQAVVFGHIKESLAKEKILLIRWKDLSKGERDYARNYYLKNVFPVLTPLSVDPGHPFPFMSNLSISLGVSLKQPDKDEMLFARVKIPKVLPQWIKIDSSENFKFVSLIDVIQNNLMDLFPSMQVLSVMPFRVTRNADSDRDEEDAEDLLKLIEEELKQRRFAEVVALTHGKNPDVGMLQMLKAELDLTDDDVFEEPGELDYTDLNAIADLPLAYLKYPSFSPVVPSLLTDENPAAFFAAIRKQDHLLHHPYESFSATVEKFIRLASEDPKVLAIKMTLYRTGDNSPFIKSLIRAAESGKQVVCLVELKARFDEERNIYWAQALEDAGVHVVYGVVGLKTHAKTALVVRQESDGLRSYCHIGTGNYNVSTARAYTDFGLLSSNEAITNEVVEFFHYLTGRSLKSNYEKLLIAPINMLSRFVAMIDREAEHARAGRPAQIIAKFNNMEENDIALSLYSASSAGVNIDLIVRGFCCLKPQQPGLSERLRVISVIGRFLEHSRVFYFRNGAADPIDGDFYIGSADWMYRNLHARVEAIVPIIDRNLKEKIWEMLQLCLNDQRQTWDMDSNGSYKQRKSEDAGVQQVLMSLAVSRASKAEDSSHVSEAE